MAQGFLSSLLYFLKKFFLFIWLYQVLVVAHGIFNLCFSMPDLVP